MAVFQPAAAIGNGRLLVTLGYAGEVMGFFWPRLDFAQQAHEVMPAVWLEADQRLHWLFEPSFQREIHYQERTNILVTTLRRDGLELQIEDFVPPSAHCAVRHFTLTNRSQAPVGLRLLQYFDLWCGEVSEKNWVYFHPDDNAFIQRFRSYCLVVGGTSFDHYTCGKAPSTAGFNAKEDLLDGSLSRQLEDLGDVAFACGWNVKLQPGESARKVLVLSAGHSEQQAMACLKGVLARPQDQLLEETAAYWHNRLMRPAPPDLPKEYASLYERCQLALPLLCDAGTGGILAAPEFDPNYEKSGGYGYCWPRDAAEVATWLAELGWDGPVRRFFDWTRAAMRQEGSFEQRYWLDGLPAPSWCSREGTMQVDESAAVVVAFGRCLKLLPPEERLSWLSRQWDSLLSTLGYLRGMLDESGLHRTATDLWETFQGSFTYTNSLIYGAFAQAAELADLLGDTSLAEGLREEADKIRQAVLQRLWVGDHFIRGLTHTGQPDLAVDCSVLGVVEPAGLLDLAEPKDRERMRKTLEVLEAKLGVKEPSGAIGLKRFEGDTYLGGPVGLVNTAWAAQVELKLALALLPHEQEAADHFVALARAHLDFCVAHATVTGLLPEEIGPTFDTAVWAAPHGWTTALFGQCCELLVAYQHRRESLAGLLA